MMAAAEIQAECEQRAKTELSDQPTGNPESAFILKCLADNEVGDARLFNHIHGDKFVIDHSANCWNVWTENFYREDVRGEALSIGISAVVEVYSKEAMRHAWNATKAEKAGKPEEAKRYQATQSALLKRIRELQAVQRRRNVLTLAAAGTGLYGDEWDRLESALACTNGVIDLRDGTIRPGRPDDYAKTICPTPYHGKDEPCPVFIQTLEQIFAGDVDLIAFFQRLLGYGLSGTQSEHILAVFEGAGANGKSTILKTLSDILGEVVLAAQSELILAQKYNRQSGAPDSATVGLRGRRLVYCEETEDGQKIDEGKTKRITGGGIITARAPWGKREISFKATFLLILCTNHKPRVTGTDYAIWRRIVLIPFTQRFVDNPTAPNEHKAARNLPAKLRAEAPGILAWLVRGCLEWQRHGLNPPEVVTAATAAYRDDEDLMKHFLDDCCLIGTPYEVKAGPFYTAYQKWCEENGHKPMSGTRFGKDMKQRFDSYPDYKGVHYIGVGLLES